MPKVTHAATNGNRQCWDPVPSDSKMRPILLRGACKDGLAQRLEATFPVHVAAHWIGPEAAAKMSTTSLGPWLRASPTVRALLLPRPPVQQHRARHFA